MKGLSLIVVKGPGPSLLGRNWLNHITLDWKSIRTISQHQGSLKSLLTEFKDVLSEGLGTIDGFTATLHLSKDARPRFWKPRPVPFSLRETVEEELD